MSGWVRNHGTQPGWFIAGYERDPGWLVTDEQIGRLGREGVAGLTVGLPPLPATAWRVLGQRCNHDASAVHEGVCECGAVVDALTAHLAVMLSSDDMTLAEIAHETGAQAIRAEIATLTAQLPRGEWGADELSTLAGWLSGHGYAADPDDVDCGAADEDEVPR